MSEITGRHLYFDCFSGIAGDMCLGALIDLGVPEDHVRAVLERLPLRGYQLEVGRANRSGIFATNLRVVVDESVHGGSGDRDGHGHRHWPVIRDWLSELEPGVARRARGMFERIVRAEARIHGINEERVHLHEVGAVDSIVDIVGSAAAIEWLAPKRVTSRVVPLGHGFVASAHGRFPVPSPAALEILRGLPTEDGGMEMELCTPTGAAIVAQSADGFGPRPAGSPLAIGYGAGDDDPPGRPNVLRAIVFEPLATTESQLVVEANLDDMNPEWTQSVLDAVFECGACDAWLSSVAMKKGRPALKLSVLCREADREAVSAAILRESTTIGVRFWPVSRQVLDREIVTVSTPHGEVAVKVASAAGKTVNAAPEFESCHEAAKSAGVPLKAVYAAALAAFHSRE